jgi:hypothetical protein
MKEDNKDVTFYIDPKQRFWGWILPLPQFVSSLGERKHQAKMGQGWAVAI